MFCVLPPCSAAGQLPLPLPLPVQIVRCWKIAMPEVVPLVGATMLTVGVPEMLGAPGLPLLLTNTIVTPPDVSFGHTVEDIGGVVAGAAADIDPVGGIGIRVNGTAVEGQRAAAAGIRRPGRDAVERQDAAGACGPGIGLRDGARRDRRSCRHEQR